jgi:hypothetical protein
MDQDPQWQSSDGTYSEADVLVAEQVRIIRCQRMCCPEHGITTVSLTTIEGMLGGIPISVTFELDIESAEAIARKYLELREAKP